MSRSFKKHPYCGDENCKKDGKRFANRRVRRFLKKDTNSIQNGKAYRKLYESWDIIDYYSTPSFNEFLSWYNWDKEKNVYHWFPIYETYFFDKDEYTLEQLKIEWFKDYKRK